MSFNLLCIFYYVILYVSRTVFLELRNIFRCFQYSIYLWFHGNMESRYLMPFSVHIVNIGVFNGFVSAFLFSILDCYIKLWNICNVVARIILFSKQWKVIYVSAHTRSISLKIPKYIVRSQIDNTMGKRKCTRRDRTKKQKTKQNPPLYLIFVPFQYKQIDSLCIHMVI